ncbi:MAG: ATP-binding protein [Gammaproteobacteria bacterium]
MRQAELLASRAFRLALFYAAVFGVSVAALLAVIYWSAGRYLESHVDEFVSSEIAMLEADHEVDGLKGMVGMIQERLAHDQSGRWVYLLADADGRRLAGNGTGWPDAQPGPDGFLTLPARNQDEPSNVRARTATFADGSRLLVGMDDYQLFELREALANAMFLGLGLALLLAVGGGWLAARASLAQIEGINRVTRQIMAGDLKRRVPVGASDDEFDRLGRSINGMLDRIGELLLAVKGATDNIAHDLRAPLARHRGRLETARMQPPSGSEFQAFIARSLEDVDAILNVFSALLRIASVESGALRQSFAPVDLGAIVRDAEQVYEPLAAARRQSLRVQVEDGLTVRGNRDLLFQALNNLLDNAVKYTPDGGAIAVTLACREGAAELTVADSGRGIPADQRGRVFERLHRLDESRSTPGSGLGLSLVRAVALLHEGCCEIGDGAPGARVTLTLPLPGPAA